MSDADDADEKGRPRKAPTAFRTISEVADDLNIPQHVLRFWESKFPQLKPLKRGGGRRYYRPEDIALLKRVGDLLYNQGYTIKGVQRLLRDGTSVWWQVQSRNKRSVAIDLRTGDGQALLHRLVRDGFRVLN